MIDLASNIPEVVAEVRELFERYEQALIDKNVEVLDATYWNSPYTIRFGPNEHGYGFDAKRRARRRTGPGTSITPAQCLSPPMQWPRRSARRRLLRRGTPAAAHRAASSARHRQ